MKLEGRTALVTGGAVRIGRAICEAFASGGCTVAVHYHTSQKAADELVSELRALGRDAFAVRGDLRSGEERERVLDEAWDKAGRIDFLVNNAGVFHKDGIESTGEEQLNEEIGINLIAPVLLTRAFAAKHAQAGRGPGLVGKVVNLLDTRIEGVEAGSLPYTLSKKMLAEFTRIAATELAPGITVNGVAPGAVLPPSPSSGVAAEPAATAPLRHQCVPCDVADAVLFLLGSDAITGQVLFVDGGRHLL